MCGRNISSTCTGLLIIPEATLVCRNVKETAEGGDGMSDLTNKIVIVTGANSGMGMATVEALSDQGATVIMLCRSEERGKKAVAGLSKKNDRKLDLMICDLGEFASIRRFVAGVKEKYPRVVNACRIQDRKRCLRRT